MFRVCRRLLIAVLSLFCGGCYLFARNVSCVIGPPEDSPAKATRWWDDYVAKNKDLDLLAVLLEASETHRRNGTAAIYANYFVGYTMCDTYSFETHFPLPMPDRAAAALRERLNSRATDNAAANFRPPYPCYWVRDATGCTKEEAMALWENAMKVVSGDEQQVLQPKFGPPAPVTP